MNIPEVLQDAIDEYLLPYTAQQLFAAGTQLSERYRQGKPAQAPLIDSDLHRASYIAVRMPATYAAVSAVFAEVRRLLPETPIRSLLDAGAGPGTAMWAAAEVFPDLQAVTLLERDSKLIEIGQKLASASSHPAIRSAQWKQHDLRTKPALMPHDLIVFSYSLGELADDGNTVLNTFQQFFSQLIIVVEPGTPRGFQSIKSFRSQLIDSGINLIAPCPHASSCPMPEGDWCHFSKRLQRTRQHRILKEGTLGYEDEKFSYLAGSLKESVSYPSRILRHPLHHSGHTGLTLCTSHGIVKQTVSRKHKEDYRLARKAEWGDSWKEV